MMPPYLFVYIFCCFSLMLIMMILFICSDFLIFCFVVDMTTVSFFPLTFCCR
uniref:Uncharacterized protein n=1 Tax=Arundo donax TaxID=35708 RepID=A0A0A9DTQ9_ARUDO